MGRVGGTGHIFQIYMHASCIVSLLKKSETWRGTSRVDNEILVDWDLITRYIILTRQLVVVVVRTRYNSSSSGVHYS